MSTIAPHRAPDAGSSPTREAAIESLKRKRTFVNDVFAYVGVNGVLWLIWVLADRSTDGFLPWPAWVSLIWGFLLALDAVKAFSRWPTGRAITEDEVDREMRRLSNS